MRYSGVLRRAIYIFVCALPLVLFCFSGGELLLQTAVAICLHEFAHLVTLMGFGGRVKSFRTAPFGLCIEYEESELSFLGELCVSLSGCAANLFSAAVAFALWQIFGFELIGFCGVNLILALVNLIPVYPLDGGRILHIFVLYAAGPSAAYRTSAIVSYVFGFASFTVSSYMLLTSVGGIYPLMFSLYLMSGTAKMLESALL